jgi:predicted DNA binding CopG/RHH family protein
LPAGPEKIYSQLVIILKMEEKKKRKKLYRKSIEKGFLKKRFEFRLTESELLELKEKAANVGLNTSEYARKKIMDTKGAVFNPRDLIDHFFQYTGAVNKIGVNINQVTHYLNYLKVQGKGTEKELIEFNRLFHRYLQLMTELNSIMKQELKRATR